MHPVLAFKPLRRIPKLVRVLNAGLPLVQATPAIEDLDGIREDFFNEEAIGWRKVGGTSIDGANNLRGEPYACWL